MLGSFTKSCYFVQFKERLMNFTNFWKFALQHICLTHRFVCYGFSYSWKMYCGNFCGLWCGYSLMFTVMQADGAIHSIWYLPPVSLGSYLFIVQYGINQKLTLNVATLWFTSVARQQSASYLGGTGFCVSWLIFFMDFHSLSRHMVE